MKITQLSDNVRVDVNDDFVLFDNMEQAKDFAVLIEAYKVNPIGLRHSLDETKKEYIEAIKELETQLDTLYKELTLANRVERFFK